MGRSRRSIQRGPTPRRRHSQRLPLTSAGGPAPRLTWGAAASAAHRHDTGPQRPAARAAEEAGAPLPQRPPALPPPRPTAGPPPACPPAPGFRHRSSSPQHLRESSRLPLALARERPASREKNSATKPAQKVGGLFKQERRNRKKPSHVLRGRQPDGRARHVTTPSGVPIGQSPFGPREL